MYFLCFISFSCVSFLSFSALALSLIIFHRLWNMFYLIDNKKGYIDLILYFINRSDDTFPNV